MEDDKKQVIPDFTLGDKPTEDGLLPLAQAVQMFNSVSGSSLSYQKAYLGVVSGKLPAVRQGGSLRNLRKPACSYFATSRGPQRRNEVSPGRNRLAYL